MARTYDFYCNAYMYHSELYIGNNKYGCEHKIPDFELAECFNCKILVTTQNRKCPQCNSGVSRWYHVRKKGIKMIVSTPVNANWKSFCPKCNDETLRASLMIMSDYETFMTADELEFKGVQHK